MSIGQATYKKIHYEPKKKIFGIAGVICVILEKRRNRETSYTLEKKGGQNHKFTNC